MSQPTEEGVSAALTPEYVIAAHSVSLHAISAGTFDGTDDASEALWLTGA
jgi:hypothetical protein